MPIRVDAYTNTGMASGWLLDAAHLRDALERGQPLELTRVTWQAMQDPAPTTLGTLAFEPDDLIVVVVAVLRRRGGEGRSGGEGKGGEGQSEESAVKQHAGKRPVAGRKSRKCSGAPSGKQ